jgi:hypothetical protein
MLYPPKDSGKAPTMKSKTPQNHKSQKCGWNLEPIGRSERLRRSHPHCLMIIKHNGTPQKHLFYVTKGRQHYLGIPLP